jgi:tetratricopeptide (TPR) repeat protein
MTEPGLFPYRVDGRLRVSALAIDGALNNPVEVRARPWVAALLCIIVTAIAAASIALRSDAYLEWRAAHMSAPALERELRARGESPRLLYYLGLRLNRERRYAEAESVLERGVGCDPGAPRLREQWAVALLGGGKTAAAFAELRQFAGVNPGLAEAHFLLGKFYFGQRSMARAAEELERSTQLDPRNGQAFLYLAGARDGLRQSEPARRAAARAVELRPDSAEAQLCLASMSGRANLPPDRVRAEFRKAIALAPASPAAHQEFARWLLDNGSPLDWPAAREHAQRAIALGVHDSTAYLVFGRACSNLGDDAASIQPLTEAARLTPDEPAPAFALWQSYRKLKQPARAAEWCRSYLRLEKAMTEKSTLMQAIAVAPHDRARRAAFALWLARHPVRHPD